MRFCASSARWRGRLMAAWPSTVGAPTTVTVVEATQVWPMCLAPTSRRADRSIWCRCAMRRGSGSDCAYIGRATIRRAVSGLLLTTRSIDGQSTLFGRSQARHLRSLKSQRPSRSLATDGSFCCISRHRRLGALGAALDRERPDRAWGGAADVRLRRRDAAPAAALFRADPGRRDLPHPLPRRPHPPTPPPAQDV